VDDGSIRAMAKRIDVDAADEMPSSARTNDGPCGDPISGRSHALPDQGGVEAERGQSVSSGKVGERSARLASGVWRRPRHEIIEAVDTVDSFKDVAT